MRSVPHATMSSAYSRTGDYERTDTLNGEAEQKEKRAGGFSPPLIVSLYES